MDFMEIKMMMMMMMICTTSNALETAYPRQQNWPHNIQHMEHSCKNVSNRKVFPAVNQIFSYPAMIKTHYQHSKNKTIKPASVQ
jgi:hypothetical protein